ncbi:histidine kinase N-terminal 7TM domain-containing diguanylate cyclase [Sediminibacillus halophilus]|uniref:Diguanylate cyclase (GGDEF) domain-containing protein n=1 Tax=Sediminibacillus halophilus TaxID=482461 RepID=A0A1G9TB05_9BACI|nr:histidine kinase N-terminal 7TM domain-containing protein [Sediminibacillus halophilus]SDM44893.1 diguanylate cyclase (GGDEF) domain-containing protein [Sediminibacillus halophilus]
MHSPLTAFITLVCTSGVLNLYLCLYVFLKRHNYRHIANYFILYSASITIYCFAYAFGLMATSLGEVKFWTAAQYVGLPFSSPLGLLFVMKYLGMKITKKSLAALLVLPFISLLMVSTNDFHHFHYRIFDIDPVQGIPYIYQEVGVWYMIHGIFTFACMFVAFLLVLSRWKETARVYRPQLFAVMCGQLVPMVTAFFYLTGFTPPGIDPVPMVLWLSSLLYLWSINSSRLFTLMPIAKDAIFHSINDGVIVLDESYRLIEFNQAVKRMLPKLSKKLFGLEFKQVWPILSGAPLPSKLEPADFQREVQLTVEDARRTYQVRTAPLQQAKGLLIIFTDITEIKRLQLRLESLAYYDELTQLYNRRAFFQKCEEAFSEARRIGSPFTVILMDVDFFKNVNDTYGHHIGDQLLVHVAKICRDQLEEDILFARYGGEEFVLGLKEKTSWEGWEIAEQLRKSVEEHPLRTTDGLVSVTLSCGVAEAEKVPGETLNLVLNKADKALYAAKGEGRNQVKTY